MKGKITNFKAEKGFGFILGEDNQKYFFHISTVENPMDIEENYTVEFKTKNSKKGLSAINIFVQAPLSCGKSKDKILKLKDLRIRASDIKEYRITKDLKDGSYRDDDLMYKYHETYRYDDEPSETKLAKDLIPPEDYRSHYFKEFILDEYQRYCYTIEITTYTSGIKYLVFKSHDEASNESNAYKYLDYIDEELEKLI